MNLFGKKNLRLPSIALLLGLWLGFSFPALVANADSPKRKIVILSASYGAGHNSSANSIKKQMEKEFPGAEVKILYAENYMRFGLGQWSKEAFNTLYQKYPRIYDIGFQFSMKDARGKESAADFSQPIFKRSALLRDLIDEQPDLVYSTHHISTSMLIRLRKDGEIGPENFKIGWIDTDFVHEPFFYLNSFGIEKTFMAHPALTTARVKLGVPAEKMATTGLPINPIVFEDFPPEKRNAFLSTAFSTPDRVEKLTPEGKRPLPNDQGPLVEKIHWPWVNGKIHSEGFHPTRANPDAFMVTIASGGSGLGDYPTIFRSVVEEARKRGKTEIQVMAMCGESQKNYDGLIRYYEEASRRGEMKGVTLAVSHGMENSKLMQYVHSSHAFIGKSGSQSPIEAAIMGVPSVLGDFLGGQEHHTAAFFKELGLAEVVKAKEQKNAGKILFDLLEDPVRMEKMKAAQKITKEAYTMEPILDFAKEAMKELDRNGKVPLAKGHRARRFELPNLCKWLLKPEPAI